MLDGDLEPDSALAGLLQDVADALPGMIAAYKDGSAFDVSGVRELTDKCFRMAEGAGADLAETMPHVDSSAGGAVSDELGH